MERVFGKREPSLFAHPNAARYVQNLANRCVIESSLISATLILPRAVRCGL
jgi:hypothetical protein